MAEAVRQGPRVGGSVREVVPRRRAERLRELSRPAREGRPRDKGRLLLGRRAGRHEDHHLQGPAGHDLPLRERAQGARRQEGRPRRDLHADDPGAPRRDARLRPHRCAVHGRVRWLLGGGALGSHQRLRGEAPHHRGRRLSQGEHRRAQEERRRRGGAGQDDREGARRTPDEAGRAMDRRTRRVVARDRRQAEAGVRGGVARERAHAVSPVHVGHHRETQGHRAHDGGVSHRGRDDPQAHLRRQGRGRVLVRRRHRLGHRSQLHRVRTARERNDRRDVRGHAGLSGQGPLVDASSRSTRSRSSTAHRRRSARS